MSVVAKYYPIGDNEDEYSVEIEQVLNDPDAAEQVAENARKALVEWWRTYRIFELSPLTGRFPDIGVPLEPRQRFDASSTHAGSRSKTTRKCIVLAHP